MNEVYVYVDLEGVPQFVGRLWTRSRKYHEAASFEYDKMWLSSTHRFALEPALALGKGAYHTKTWLTNSNYPDLRLGACLQHLNIRIFKMR